MLDFNRAERRALASALVLIGAGLVGRAFLAPASARSEWLPETEPWVERSGAEGAVREALDREQRAQEPLGSGERIELNTAPAEELRRLPGVGPSLARAIIAERQKRPFRSPEEIDRVPGVGEVTVQRLMGHLAVRNPAPAGVVVIEAANGGCGPDDDRVDINRATRTGLMKLPGIGAVIAERVLVERARQTFEDVSALTRVSGIGPASVERLYSLACAGRP